jgi:Na+/H+ antiporter NhaD/arsenite permease-like protein
LQAVSRLGLIAWIGDQTKALILAVPPDYQLAVAIIVILWVSALASSFVDNIPLTTMMVRIVCSLAHNEELSLDLQPLVWALAFGACLGGEVGPPKFSTFVS